MESFTKTLPRVDPEVCEAADEIEAEAIRIFRIVNGEGDAGSEQAYYAQNVALRLGWRILAYDILKLKKALEAKKSKKSNDPTPNPSLELDSPVP